MKPRSILVHLVLVSSSVGCVSGTTSGPDCETNCGASPSLGDGDGDGDGDDSGDGDGASGSGGNASQDGEEPPEIFWDESGGYGHDLGKFPSSGADAPRITKDEGVLRIEVESDLSSVFFGFGGFSETFDFSESTTLSITYRSTTPVRLYLLFGADPGENWALVGAGPGSYVVPYYPGEDGGVQQIVLPPAAEWQTREIVIETGVDMSELRQIQFSSLPNGATLEVDSLFLHDAEVVEQLDKFEPSRGSTYFVVGQYAAGVSEYLNQFSTPAGVMYYLSTDWDVGWSKAGAGGTLAFDQQSYPGTFLQMGLFLDGQACDYIQGAQAGAQNPYLDDLAGRLKQTARPVFLRVGYEFDNNDAGHGCGGDPAKYKAVFRQIVTQIRERNDARNVAFVWHTAGDEATIDGNHLTSWYPGDDVVDWFGISLFGHGFEYKIAPLGVLETFAENHDKPIMVAESSITATGPAPYDAWQSFLGPLLGYIEMHDRVKALSFIHTNWQGDFGFSFDSRFTVGLAEHAERFHARLSGDRFLMAHEITWPGNAESISLVP